MTGFRIGYAIADPKTIEKMAKLQALCLTNVAEPIQYAALKALDADVTPNVKSIRSKIDTVIQEAKIRIWNLLHQTAQCTFLQR